MYLVHNVSTSTRLGSLWEQTDGQHIYHKRPYAGTQKERYASTFLYIQFVSVNNLDISKSQHYIADNTSKTFTVLKINDKKDDR